MAYQNVGTPRFYVDWMQYARALGIGSPVQEASFGLNPSGQYSFATTPYSNIYKTFKGFDFTAPIPKLNYIAILGHNLGDFNTSGFQMRLDSDVTENDYVEYPSDYEIVNASYSNWADFRVTYSGFSIVKCTEPTTPDGANRINFRIQTDSDENVKIGAFSTGSIYDMPHSPDLNLKMSIEMDGVKNIQTKGGATLSNASYTKPADWGDRGAWQLGDNTPNYRSGRRVWDLSFSYLSDSDVMPVVAATTNLEAGYAENTPVSENTLLDGTDFFSQVWNKTMGGHLPFIFQPDKDNSNPDQFAIARFDQSSLQYDQVANNVYNVKLKIRECW